jgi:hypothetical protein
MAVTSLVTVGQGRIEQDEIRRHGRPLYAAGGSGSGGGADGGLGGRGGFGFCVMELLSLTKPEQGQRSPPAPAA